MTHAASSRGRHGFTLIEVMVALGLLAGGFLAVAQLLVFSSRVSHRSRATTTATRAAAAQLERLQSLAWGYTNDGAEVGTLIASPAGALSCNTPGFFDYLDDRGVVVGSGLSPPAAAMFVRRWSLEWDDGGVPGEKTMKLGVVVLRREVTRSPERGSAVAWAEELRLVGTRTRRPG